MGDLMSLATKIDGTDAGIPDVLNVKKPECWRNNVVAMGPKESQLRDLKARVEKPAKPSKPAESPNPAKVEEPAVVQESKMTPKPMTKPKKAAPAKKGAAAPVAAPQKRKTAKPAATLRKAQRSPSRAPLGRVDGLRENTKQAVMLDMALRDEGASEAAICKKLGWKKCRVTLKRVCEKVGAKLVSRKNVKNETIFFATMPKTKAGAGA